MTIISLIRSSLAHYWRTNLAVVAGVAAAVTVLSGALLVGESVRGSLRDLVEARLGATDLAVVSQEFFRTALADDLKGDAAFARDFRDITPMISATGVAADQASGRRASRVQVYGDVAVATYYSRGYYGPEGSGRALYFKETDVLVCRAGGWKIVHIHVSGA